MPFIKQTLLIDLIRAFWITGVFLVLFYWLPTTIFLVKPEQSKGSPKVFESNSQDSTLNASEIVGYCLRITLGVIVGILALSYLHLLNWLTLILLYVALLVINYWESNNWQLKSCQEIIQNKIFNLVDILDRGLSIAHLLRAIDHTWHRKKQQVIHYIVSCITQEGTAYVVFLTVILAFAVLLRWEYPLLELRFSHPESYNHLAIAQQISSGKLPQLNYVPVFSALAAVLSMLGSIDAMQVIRFLSPILGIVTVLSVGYFVRVVNRDRFSALIAMFMLGIYLFTWEQTLNAELPVWLTNIVNSLNNSLVRQWTGNELEIGIIALLLALGYFFDDQQHQKSIAFKINIVCSLMLVAISAPPLLILAALAPIGLLGGKKLVLIGITSAWIILAVFAALTPEELAWTQSFLLTLPIALSLLAALVFSVIVEVCQVISKKWAETFCLALVIALSCNFLLPLTPQLTYVEYDITARKSLEIKNLFPRNNWTLAAPTEQLAQIYGSGWYEDLALFVEQYGDKAANPKFQFPIGGKDLFVFVEKIPFVTFANEPTALPHSILGDHTYRYYRSTTGRASLEFEALQMCEAYRQNHPDSQIYFENKELRIYQFKA